MRRMTRHRIVSLCLGAVGMLLGIGHPTARGQTAPSRPELLDYLVSGMKTEREKLRSGIVRARGEKSRVDNETVPIQGQIELFAAFDYSTRSFRFDRSEPNFVNRFVLGKTEKLVSSGVERTEEKFIKVPGQSISWQSDATTRAPILIDRERVEQRLARLPFDIRAVGLLLWSDMTRYDLDGLVEAYRDPSQEIVEVAEVPGEAGIYRVVSKVGKRKDMKRVLEIDTNKGFSPRKLEVFQPISYQKPDEWSPQPSQSGASEWERKADTWVPKSWKVMSRQQGRFEDRLAYTFTWEAVNQAVPKGLFSYADFKAPPGTLVLDQRTGRQIVVDRIGGVPADVPASRVPSHAPGVWKAWVLAGNAALLCAAIGVILWRRSASRKGALTG